MNIWFDASGTPPMKWLPLATSVKITCAKNEAAPVTALCIRVIAAAIADFLPASSRPVGAEQKYVGIFVSRSPSDFWPRASVAPIAATFRGPHFYLLSVGCLRDSLRRARR